ncbi:SURF1 family protein [Microbacterium sp. cx-55]|uniref:SURF1 family cytochrome oxidase biogenesis protein n=1 Tax=Microbacterium sp. cx-55 TaxID=2875948 RepID=UPI001CC07EA9|nr:SURF1 family protein [Microbacterium sp. cx-55]MBZ4486490.1 SURF1 family protein [Microbacterium sp. cx-55]UGB36541.1 SURF1 family protein [Microbacterium sp. cx-55]
MNLKTAPAAVRWSVYAAIALIFAIICVMLSNWQFSRNDARAEQLALAERNYDAAPLALDDAVSSVDVFDGELEWHPVAVEGSYLPDDQLVVRNRPHGGTSAFEVLVPFRADDGRILIVNRGWVPPAESGDGPAVIAAPPAGDVTITVRMRPGEALPTSGRSAPAGQVPTIALPLIAETAGPDTITSAYGILATEDPAPTERPQPLDAPSIDPGPFLSYAIQWILFAIMGFVFIGYIIRTEVKHAREDAAEDRVPDAPRPARARRTDRDAVDEDALLDHIGH